MRKKLTAPEAEKMLKKLGLSYRKIGDKAKCSFVTARRVILELDKGYYSKATAERVWQTIEDRRQELRKAA
jgi:hypothetical protein